jgi:hypothetical protein
MFICAGRSGRIQGKSRRVFARRFVQPALKMEIDTTLVMTRSRLNLLSVARIGLRTGRRAGNCNGRAESANNRE